MNTLVTRARRAMAEGGDRGSLPMAMLLILVGVSLSGVLATFVLNQLTATKNTVQRSDAVDAAQSGLDVAIGHIRIAQTSTGAGDPAKLPCGPFSGAVNTGTKQSYSVSIFYLTTTPPAGNLAYATANKMPCTTAGYYTGSTVPIYVFLASTGKAFSTDPGRTVYATYTLHIKSRDNVAGGLIPMYGDPLNGVCFSAPSASPAAGAPLSMQTCDDTKPEQMFAYASNLNLILTSTQANGAAGMCLDAAPTNNEPVVFQPCSTTTVARQQWSLNDRANFEGTTDGVSLNRMCFHLTDAGAVNSAVVLHAVASDAPGTSQQDAACDGDYTNTRSFAPRASVGTGRAGDSTRQLVNFQQFGRCLDVSGDDVNTTFLVIWPCKQKPSGAIQWNQVWTLNPTTTGGSTGQIYTYTNSKNYCLTSPGSIASGQYVVVQECTLTTSPILSQTWTKRGATGVFATAYRIESSYGAAAGTTYCMQPTDPTATPPDYWQWHGDISKLVLNNCNSDRLQKWNASPTILQSSLTDVSEK